MSFLLRILRCAQGGLCEKLLLCYYIPAKEPELLFDSYPFQGEMLIRVRMGHSHA